MRIDYDKVVLGWLSLSILLLAYLFFRGGKAYLSLEIFSLSLLSLYICIFFVMSSLIGLILSGHSFEKEQVEIFSGLVAVALSLVAETLYYSPDIIFLKYLLSNLGFAIGITILFLSAENYFIKVGVIKSTSRTFKPFIVFSLTIIVILSIFPLVISITFKENIPYRIENDYIEVILNIIIFKAALFYGFYLAYNYKSYSYPIEAFKILIALGFIFEASYILIRILAFAKGYFSIIDAVVSFTAVNIALLIFIGGSMLLVGASMPITRKYSESVLLGITSIVGYSEYIRDILASYARQGYLILVITRRGSPLLSVFYEFREKSFTAYLDPETSYPRSISPTEFTLPPETAHIVKLVKTVKSLSKTNVLIIFDNLTDIYVMRGDKKSYEIVKEISRILSPGDIVYFIVYVKAHEEKSIEVLKSLTGTYLKI
ncbi:MAG: hypothetical protein DRJ52_10390 [Thermoprotei archaeon]|nr:MAG: hypothetical protein DRJ52_10390 [Thermoprotei archaeon]